MKWAGNISHGETTECIPVLIKDIGSGDLEMLCHSVVLVLPDHIPSNK